MLGRRGFRMRPWAVEWDEGAMDFLLEGGFSAELGARPLKRAVERLPARAACDRDRRAAGTRGRPVPLHHRRGGDQLACLVHRPGRGRAGASAGADVRPGSHHVARRATRVAARPSWPRWHGGSTTGWRRSWRAWGERGRPTRSRRRPASRGSGSARTARRDAGVVEYVDRLEAAWRTGERLAERLGARLGSAAGSALAGARRSSWPSRLHVLAAALAGLDAREASDATLSRSCGPRGGCRPHASGSSRSSRRCTSAGPTAAGCGSAATARTATPCSRSPGSAPTRC